MNTQDKRAGRTLVFNLGRYCARGPANKGVLADQTLVGFSCSPVVPSLEWHGVKVGNAVDKKQDPPYYSLRLADLAQLGRATDL